MSCRAFVQSHSCETQPGSRCLGGCFTRRQKLPKELDTRPRWQRCATRHTTLRLPSRQLVEGSANRPLQRKHVVSVRHLGRWDALAGSCRCTWCAYAKLLSAVSERNVCRGTLRLANFCGFAGPSVLRTLCSFLCGQRTRCGVVVFVSGAANNGVIVSLFALAGFVVHFGPCLYRGVSPRGVVRSVPVPVLSSAVFFNTGPMLSSRCSVKMFCSSAWIPTRVWTSWPTVSRVA